jgi:hypothetical protein
VAALSKQYEHLDSTNSDIQQTYNLQYHVLAKIVATRLAFLAVAASNTGFHSYAVTNLEVFDFVTYGNDNTSRLMAKNHGSLQLEVVNVRTTDTSDLDVKQNLYNKTNTGIASLEQRF